jgi:hypothetical protein
MAAFYEGAGRGATEHALGMVAEAVAKRFPETGIGACSLAIALIADHDPPPQVWHQTEKRRPA